MSAGGRRRKGGGNRKQSEQGEERKKLESMGEQRKARKSNAAVQPGPSCKGGRERKVTSGGKCWREEKKGGERKEKVVGQKSRNRERKGLAPLEKSFQGGNGGKEGDALSFKEREREKGKRVQKAAENQKKEERGVSEEEKYKGG